MEPIKAIRGMNDILPSETLLWQQIEATMRQTIQSFGYQEIRFPIVEKTELFKRSIGDTTDIVTKEMYTFLDRNEESLTLRPEGTAVCVRAGIEHGLFYNQIQRLWYLGPYFRYERPQKGRSRQFHHCGAEIFGLNTPDADAELILLSASILQKLGLIPWVTLQINSLGSPASRLSYRQQLVEYFTQHEADLDEESRVRLVHNPLRILDSKNPDLAALIEKAPSLLNYLDDESKIHFEKLQTYLTTLGIVFTVNPRLVRGLDYYTKTVFEWVTHALGSQGTVCAGGRYDNLTEQLGGKPTPALGFAFGMERTVLLAQETQPMMTKSEPSIYFMIADEEALAKAFLLANQLRDAGWKVFTHCGGGSLKNQFKKADKSGATIGLILAEEEFKAETITIKWLREDKPQITVLQKELMNYL